MFHSLPPAVEAVAQRLIQDWVGQQKTSEAQADGLAMISGAFWTVLAPTLGTVATRAIFMRAIGLATRKSPQLGSIRVSDQGVDLSRFRSTLNDQDREATHAALASVVVELLVVLDRLLGQILTPMLGEVELELARMTSDHGDTTAKEGG